MSDLTIAAIQTHPEFGDIPGNLRRALDLVPARCDLAVLPELFATGYQFRDAAEASAVAEEAAPGGSGGPITAALTAKAAATGTTLVAGLAEKSAESVFNSAVLVRPDGSREIYRKVHLFDREKEIFQPGDRGFGVFSACGTRVGMMVCFDWLFPEAARTLALAGAQVICHPSNLILPWCPAAMVTRCQENRVFAVTANRVGSEHRTDQHLEFIGMSQIVSPLGDILARMDRQGEGAVAADIDPDAIVRQVTPHNHIFADRRPEHYGI